MSAPTTQVRAQEQLHYVPTIEGLSVAVSVSGPATSPVAVMFSARRRLDADDAVLRRLHRALLRTVVIAAHPRLNTKSVISILDALDIPWALLVSGRVGGELAWNLAATRQERFNGLVAINCGHPRVPDITGVIRDNCCPPVEINTTMLVDTRARHAVARATSRYVYGEFRVAQLLDGRHRRESIAQLATEIVLRAYSW